MTTATYSDARPAQIRAARLFWFLQSHVVVQYAKRRGKDMHVINPTGLNLAYVSIPKNACTSIKTALFDIHTPYRNTAYYEWKRNHIHRYFHRYPDAWMSLDDLRQLNKFRFAIIRHPLDRFLSAYRNRIVKFRDIETDPLARMRARLKRLEPQPSLEEFASRLSEYASICGSIAHHVRPQARFVHDRSALDAVYSINELDRLTDDVKAFSGINLHVERKNKSENAIPKASANIREEIERYYHEDFEMFPELHALK